MRLHAALTALLLAIGLTGCNQPPPPSQLPNAQAAIDRMRATSACGNALRGDATIDNFGSQGRIRTSITLLAARPAKVRLDAIAPVVGSVGTLTSDGVRFGFNDLRGKRFLVGPASACNIARITQMPIPGNVLVDLLRGQAPVLRRDGAPSPATIEWSGSGYYVVRIPSTRSAREELHLAPTPADWNKPWAEQRMRVLDVQVWQEEVLLYHAELEGHASAAMAKLPPSDPAADRLDAVLGDASPKPTWSGPTCDAEVPRRVHVSVPAESEDVIFRYDEVVWNPPLDAGSFVQPPPDGVPIVNVDCDH